jgi:hypothetical protein
MDKVYGPLVINLEKRKDRLESVTNELKRMSIDNFRRIAASTGGGDAGLGCLESHCLCLEDFLETNSEEKAVMICEDDALFKCDRISLDKHIEEFLADEHAQVACLGFNSKKNEIYLTTQLFLRARDIQTRVCYIVKRSIAAELNTLWRKICELRKSRDKSVNWYSTAYRALPITNNGTNIDMYRGDQSWKILQQDHIFLIPKTRLVIQRPSYSDIEKRNVNYHV